MQGLSKDLFPETDGDFDVKYVLKYISTGIQDTAEINLMKAYTEVSKMAGITEDMFSRFLRVFRKPDSKLGKEVKKIKDMEDFTDQMQEQLSSYLIECLSEGLNEIGSRSVAAMLRIINELESIGDSCFNLILLAERRYNKKMHFDEDAINALTPMTETVTAFIDFIRVSINHEFTEQELSEANRLETEIDKQRKLLRKASRKRMQKGSDVKSELLYLEIVKHLEHIGDYSLNIAETLRQLQD